MDRYPNVVVRSDIKSGDKSLQMSVMRRREVVRKVRRALSLPSPLPLAPCVAEFDSLAITKIQSLQTARSMPVVAILPPEAKIIRRPIENQDIDRRVGSSIADTWLKRMRKIA